MMNAEQIVKALRNTCNGCNPTPCCEFEVLGDAAATLIENQAAETAAKDAEIARLTEINESNGQAIGLLTSDYEAQLRTAQRRADAAVADMALIAGDIGSPLTCAVCKYNPNDMGCELDGSQFDDDGECHFEWRGLMAERGEGV
jgi:hypothetical protein